MSAYSSLIIADGPTSYWRFDETSGTTATDQMAAHSGTYTSTFTLNQPGALVASGDLDASVLLGGGYVTSSSYTPFVSGGQQTFEGWFNASSFASSMSLLAGTNTSTGPTIWNSGNVAIEWLPNNGATFGSWSIVFATNRWYHFALTWNDSSKVAEMFINGVSQGQKGVAQSYTTTGTLVMGAFGAGTHQVPGRIDEYAIYSKILTGAQIANHYAVGATLFTPQRFLPVNTLQRGVQNLGQMALFRERLPAAAYAFAVAPSGALSFAATGAANVQQTDTGVGALTFAATASAIVKQTETGTGSLSFSGSGTGRVEQVATGTGSLAFAGTATVPSSGTGALTFAGVGQATVSTGPSQPPSVQPPIRPGGGVVGRVYERERPAPQVLRRYSSRGRGRLRFDGSVIEPPAVIEPWIEEEQEVELLLLA